MVRRGGAAGAEAAAESEGRWVWRVLAEAATKGRVM